MTVKSSKVMSQKLDELQGQDTCGGDLSQHIILTTEDKVCLAFKDLREKQKHMGSWPAHFSAAISLFVTALSFSEFPENFKFMGLSVQELRIAVVLLTVLFCWLGCRSAWYTLRNQSKTTVECLLAALDPKRTQNNLKDVSSVECDDS